MSELTLAIEKHPFLRGMAPEHVALLARSATEINLEADHVIFHEGEAAYQFFLLTEGKVVVESHRPGAGNIPVRVLEKGEVLGWSWLFPPFNWHFQARTLDPTKAILLDGAKLLVTCERNHYFGYTLMKRIAQVVIDRLRAERKYLLENRAEDNALAVVDLTPPSTRQPEAPCAQTLRKRLAGHPFVEGLNEKFLGVLAECAMASEFAPDQVVFREGEIANRFYLIERGKVVIEVPETDHRSVPIQVVTDGDVLGWSWLFAPYYWHFDARALRPTSAIFLYGTRLREYCEQDHDLGYEMLKRICHILIQRLQATRKQVLALKRENGSGVPASCPVA